MMRLSLVSLASKAAVTVAQLVATGFVLLYLSPHDQGYYYSFIALIAVQGIFELGLSQVLVVFLSHEAISVTRKDLEEYRPKRRSRAIASASLQQYVKLTVLFAVCVGVAGAAFFYVTQGIDLTGKGYLHWALPWCLLVASSSLRLPLIWLEAVIEGLGEIRYVMLARIVAQFAWLSAFALAVRFEHGLFAPAAATLALVVTSSVAYWPYRSVIRRLTHRPVQQGRRIDWKREIGPMQRRVSGSWIASYLISNTPVPIIFALLGAVEAGRAGVAFQVAAAIGVIAGALVGPKISIASRLVAEQLVQEYRKLFLSTMRLNMAASATVVAVGVVAVLLLPITAPALTNRLPSVLETMPLLIAAMINSFMSCVAVFSRAQKTELFTMPLFLVALLTMGSSLAAQGAGGILTITCLHALAALCITLPFSVVAFRRTASYGKVLHPVPSPLIAQD
jgi:hypothetical protein